MTEEEIDAISARAEAATPGPWITTGDEGYDEDFTHVVGVIEERWNGSRGFSLLADCAAHHEGSNQGYCTFGSVLGAGNCVRAGV